MKTVQKKARPTTSQRKHAERLKALDAMKEQARIEKERQLMLAWSREVRSRIGRKGSSAWDLVSKAALYGLASELTSYVIDVSAHQINAPGLPRGCIVRRKNASHVNEQIEEQYGPQPSECYSKDWSEPQS